MKPFSADTSIEMQRQHFQMMRTLSPGRRLQLALELTDSVRKFILADLRYRFPEESEEQIKRRFIARVLPRGEVIRVYGFDPDELVPRS